MLSDIYTVICFFFRCKIIFACNNLYENFLHENFYTRSNYSNRAVIHVNHMKIFCTKIKQFAVHPILEFVAVIWSPHIKASTQQVEMLQRNTARFVFRDFS